MMIKTEIRRVLRQFSNVVEGLLGWYHRTPTVLYNKYIERLEIEEEHAVKDIIDLFGEGKWLDREEKIKIIAGMLKNAADNKSEIKDINGKVLNVFYQFSADEAWIDRLARRLFESIEEKKEENNLKEELVERLGRENFIVAKVRENMYKIQF